MEETFKTILTNMCMVKDGNKILLQKKVDGDFSGTVLPGGHIDEGEPLVTSVIREVYEETGLTISSPKLCGMKNWFLEDGTRYLVFIYLATEFSGELRSSEEGEMYWEDIDDIYNGSIEFVWNMKEVFDICLKGEYSELFCYNEDNKWQFKLY